MGAPGPRRGALRLLRPAGHGSALRVPARLCLRLFQDVYKRQALYCAQGGSRIDPLPLTMNSDLFSPRWEFTQNLGLSLNDTWLSQDQTCYRLLQKQRLQPEDFPVFSESTSFAAPVLKCNGANQR